MKLDEVVQGKDSLFSAFGEYVFSTNEIPNRFKLINDTDAMGELGMKTNPGTIFDTDLLNELDAFDTDLLNELDAKAGYGAFYGIGETWVLLVASFKLKSREKAEAKLEEIAEDENLLCVFIRSDKAAIIFCNWEAISKKSDLLQAFFDYGRNDIIKGLEGFRRRLDLDVIWKNPLIRTTEDIDKLPKVEVPKKLYDSNGRTYVFKTNLKPHRYYSTDAVVRKGASNSYDRIDPADSRANLAVVFDGEITVYPVENIRKTDIKVDGETGYVVYKSAHISEHNLVDGILWKNSPSRGAYSLEGVLYILVDQEFINNIGVLRVHCEPYELMGGYHTNKETIYQPTDIPGIYAAPIKLRRGLCRRSITRIRGRDNEIEEMDIAIETLEEFLQDRRWSNPYGINFTVPK